MRTNRKHQVLKSTSAARISGFARKPEKTAGTRVGGMVDWREGGAKGTGEKSRFGRSVRDGR